MSSSTSIARRDDAVLAVVDVQERLAAVMERREAVVAAVAKLVKVASLAGVPVIATRQYPKGLGGTDPRLEAGLAEAEAAGTSVARIDKVAFDCFADSGFAEAFGGLGRRQLVIAGMESHICVAQTALSALRRGIDVHVVADACCSRDEASHTLALERLRAAGVAVTVFESVAYELVGAAGSDEFRALLQIVKE